MFCGGGKKMEKGILFPKLKKIIKKKHFILRMSRKMICGIGINYLNYIASGK